MRDFWYELVDMDKRGERGDIISSADTWDEIIAAAAKLRGPFTIDYLDRAGDEAEHTEVAYRAGVGPELWISEPNLAGVAPAKFTIRRDPNTLPGKKALMDALKSLPYYTDSSYGNDVSPSRTFLLGDTGYKLYIAPGRIAERSDEQFTQYTIFALEDGGDPDATFSDSTDAEMVLETEDPLEVMEFIRAHNVEIDPLTRRARLLDLQNKRRSGQPGELGESDLDQRAKLLDLGLDDLNVNPARRRARRNPADLEEAKAKYEEFHRHPAKKIFTDPKRSVPGKVRELGRAAAVLYRSDKNDPDTGRPVKKPIDYIHEHDAGVRAYAPASNGTIDVPAWIREATALVLLGKCLGFDFEDSSGVREAKGIRPLPDLYTTPCGRALLVIQDRTDVLAIIWGGGLGVEARGIVG